jgi:hypothetical protein
VLFPPPLSRCLQGTLSAFLRLPAVQPGGATQQQQQPLAVLGTGDDPLPWSGSLRGDEGVCPVAREHAEYGGDVVRWGADHLLENAAACCAACAAHAGCSAWVYCASAQGCSAGSRAHRECWLKRAALPAKPQVAVRLS